MHTNYFWMVSLVVSLIALDVRGGSLVKTSWTCKVPCIDKNQPSEILSPVNFTYCGVKVLTQEMISSANPLCSQKNLDPNAIAAHRDEQSILLADCTNT